MQISPRTLRARSRAAHICIAALPSRDKKLAPAKSWGKKEGHSTESRTTTKQQPTESSDEGWGLLDLSRMNYRWAAPWGAPRVLVGMSAWVVLFVGVSFILVPALYNQAGIDLIKLDAADKTTFTLVNQVLDTVVSLALIRLLTFKDLEEEPESVQKTFFNYSPSAPFSSPNGWAVWALIGVLLSPLVVVSTAGLLSLIGYEDNVGGRGTVDGVVQMISIDGRSFVNLLTVTGVLAPILEETVFRGFLLTSLTRWMPPLAAIPISSFFFALAHLSPRDFPVLFSIGCLLGIVYVRSTNLLTPIIVHGAWNSTVLSVLFALSASGIDIEELIKTAR